MKEKVSSGRSEGWRAPTMTGDKGWTSAKSEKPLV
jgi:hypothetical protein